MASRPSRDGRRKASRGPNALIIGLSVAAGFLVVAALIWSLVYFSKPRGEPRLVGTWKSDAEATIAERRKSHAVTDQQAEAMRKLFGKMKVTFTDKTVTTEFDGVVETQPYQVVKRDAD